MSAPGRVWAIPDTSGVSHEWHSGWYQGRPSERYTAPYILATPEALVASPEVQALVAEAVARERERCAKALQNIRALNMTQPDENGHSWAVSDLIEQEIAFFGVLV